MEGQVSSFKLMRKGTYATPDKSKNDRNSHLTYCALNDMKGRNMQGASHFCN